MKRFMNLEIIYALIVAGLAIVTELICSSAGVALAVAATAVTKVVEGHFAGAKMEVYSFSIDPGSIAAFSQEIETIAITGARAGDPCFVSLEAPTANLNTQGAKVTANDVVSFYLENNQATTAVDAGATVGYLMIFKKAIGS